MIKKIFITIILCAICSTCYATSIAIEFRENNKFSGIIGKAYYEGTYIEIVTFIESDGRIVPFAWIYQILESSTKREGIHHVKCQNQLGVIASGTINLQDILNPKINLITDIGIVITNISEEGKRIKKKYLPKIDLGK